MEQTHNPLQLCARARLCQWRRGDHLPWEGRNDDYGMDVVIEVTSQQLPSSAASAGDSTTPINVKPTDKEGKRQNPKSDLPG